MIDSGGIKISGKGHVIAVSGVYDLSRFTPAPHGFIKGAHHQIGDGRGSRRALGQAFPAAAQICQKSGGGRRKQRIREGGADNPGKENTVKKMADIQLEHLLSPGMRPGIGQDVRAFPIGPGAVRYRPLLQHMVQDIALHGLQQAAGNHKRPCPAILFCQNLLMVILRPPVAEHIKTGKLLFPAHTGAVRDKIQRKDKVLALFFGTVFPKLRI